MIYLNDHIEEIDVEQALSVVSEQRRQYALHYRQQQDRRLSLAVYLLLCKALKTEYGITKPPEFTFGPHGKPTLRDHPDIHFNLSHCPRAALCVVSDQPVGCDIECVPAELDMDLCRYCCTDEETAAILASDNPTLAFTELWTKKEAYMKLTGEGLTSHFSFLASHFSLLNSYTSLDRSYVYTVCHHSAPEPR